MNSIHRVNLKLLDHQEISLTGPPISALASRTDNNSFDLWYEHYEGSPTAFYTIYFMVTGGRVPWALAERNNFRHLGTFVALDGYQIGHVYVGNYA
jgi:hypothetical protein